MERPFDPLHPRGFVTTRIPFCFPSPHRTRKLVFRSRNGNDEVSTTRVSSFEFRISSTRFFHFSIFLSLSIINSLLSSAPSPFFPLSLCHRSTPPLLHSLFPFSPRHSPPLLPPPPLLGSSRCFPSLSLCRSSLSRVGHGQRSASQPGGEVWQRRESGCASGTGARGGDCGKILMPATVCPPPVVLTTTVATGNPARLPAFTLQERFTAHAKKEGRSREEGEKGISLGASRENSIR